MRFIAVQYTYSLETQRETEIDVKTYKKKIIKKFISHLSQLVLL